MIDNQAAAQIADLAATTPTYIAIRQMVEAVELGGIRTRLGCADAEG